MKPLVRRTLLAMLYRGCCRQAAAPPGPLLDCKRVVVIRFDEIGDLILTLPFLRELRQSMPHARIALVVRPALVNLVQLCPHVDAIIPFAPKFGFRPGRLIKLLALRKAVFSALGGVPELGILPRFDADFSRGLIALLAAGAQWRIAFSESATPEKAVADIDTDRFLTQAIKPPPGELHELNRNLSLLEALGAAVQSDRLELYLSGEDRNKAAQILSPHSHIRVWVGLCAGASIPRKRWPVDRFTQVAKHVMENIPDCGVVVIGGPDDRNAGVFIQQHIPGTVVNVAGELTLRETAAVLANCALYIGNDTGPMHLAAAVGVPVVAIFADPRPACAEESGGNPPPARFDPCGVPYRIVTPPAGETSDQSAMKSRCGFIDRVMVNDVMDAVAEVLSRSPQNAKLASSRNV